MEQENTVKLEIGLIQLLYREFGKGWDNFLRFLYTLTSPPYWLHTQFLHWWKQEDGSYLLVIRDLSGINSLNILGGIDFFDVRLFEKVEISPWFWKFKKKKVGIAVSVKYQIATFNDYWCNINEEVFCPDSVWGDILLMEVTEKWEDYKKKIERREKVNQKRLSKGLEPLPLEEIYPRTILLP